MSRSAAMSLNRTSPMLAETDDVRSLAFAVPDGVDIPADRLRRHPASF